MNLPPPDMNHQYPINSNQPSKLITMLVDDSLTANGISRLSGDPFALPVTLYLITSRRRSKEDHSAIV